MADAAVTTSSEQPTQAPSPEKRPLFSPFNIIAALILLATAPFAAMRFFGGLGAVTALDHTNPWGIWIGFDLLTGVALAAGGYVTSAAVYIFGKEEYHSAVRPAILTGFLGYGLVVFALLFDVGRPWRLPYPFFVSQGVTSIMFEVGACVALYLTVLFLEFSPAAMEWLGLKKVRWLVIKLTILLTILGVLLSTLHQSSLGAMYLLAPSKLHPLWYSTYLPVFFFVSSIAAGLSMIIFESTMAHRYFPHLMDKRHKEESNKVALGFGRAAALVLAAYSSIKIFGIAADNNWAYLFTGYGLWFLVELVGFVMAPAFFFAVGVRDRNLRLIRACAIWTVVGIVLNRFNISLIAFNWHLPEAERYFPALGEFAISIFIVTIGIVVYRFIVTRMPILYHHPDYHD